MAVARFQKVRLFYGEDLLLPMDEHGSYLCPVCGESWNDAPPYGENGQPSFDMCSRCGVEYGYHDCADRLRPSEPLEQRIVRLRVEWLNSQEWSREALEHLENQLRITEQEARRAAESLGP